MWGEKGEEMMRKSRNKKRANAPHRGDHTQITSRWSSPVTSEVVGVSLSAEAQHLRSNSDKAKARAAVRAMRTPSARRPPNGRWTEREKVYLLYSGVHGHSSAAGVPRTPPPNKLRDGGHESQVDGHIGRRTVPEAQLLRLKPGFAGERHAREWDPSQMVSATKLASTASETMCCQPCLNNDKSSTRGSYPGRIPRTRARQTPLLGSALQ